MAKVKGRKTDVAATYMCEDDGVHLLFLGDHMTVSLEDLPGEQLDSAIKNIKKKSTDAIQFTGITVTLNLTKTLMKDFIRQLEGVKEERDSITV